VPPDETDLRALCEAGDHDAAMTAAVQRYGRELFGFLLGLSGDHDRAGDAFSAMCERAWTALPKFRWDSSLRVWLYTIARHEFLRAVRRDRRNLPLSVAPAVAEAVAVIRTATAAHQRTEIKAAFAKVREALAPEDHMLLGLRLDRRLAWNEIATILGDGDPAHLGRDAAVLRKRYQRLKARLQELSAQLLPDRE
jgi:RNA polymerase sigma-70 factor (ECF subfamily)